MTNQPNSFTLLPEELRSYCALEDIPSNSLYIKQGSDTWHSLRSKAKITGSTFSKAIGLEGLKQQKEHHYEYILGKKPPPPSEELQARFDHGCKFEAHALATLVSAVMPAILPPCYSFFEVGSLVLNHEDDEHFLVMSPDRMLECIHGETSCQYDKRNH